MKRTSSYIFIASSLLVMCISCSKKLDLTPISSISDANFWKTPDQFDAFVTGINSRFRSHNGAFELLGEFRADIFGTDPNTSGAFTGESSQGLERMWLQTLDLDNPGVSNFGGLYSNIVQINLLIEKLNTTEIVTGSAKRYYLGLAYGMRAFYYFQLTRSWGDVVIQTEPIVSLDISNLSKAASSAADVMKLIKQDIDSSTANFGNDYTIRNQKATWSKAATLMLKGEVYLWTSYRGGGTADATIAKNALTEIRTNIPALALIPNYADIFSTTNRGNNEMIFASRYLLNEATMGFITASFVPQTGLIANFYDSVANRQFNATADNWGGLLRAPTKIAAFRAFNDRDSRKWASIQPAYQLVSGTYRIAGAFVKKYQGEQNAGARNYTNDFPIYRFADLLLLMAEAKLILGEDPAAEINLVRARAYGSNYNTTTIAYPRQAIDANPKEAILQERFYEFIFEGKRWYDLRRMGDAFVYAHTTVLSSQSYKLLWPVDRSSLTNNRSLVQNPGYPAF